MNTFLNYRILKKISSLFWLALTVTSLASGANPSRCINNADDVVLRGIATKESLKITGHREMPVWILTTESSICINEFNDTGSLKKSPSSVSRIQILGAPPPVGVLIELKGRLNTGNFTPFYATSNSISVISGMKVRRKNTEGSASTGSADANLVEKSEPLTSGDGAFGSANAEQSITEQPALKEVPPATPDLAMNETQKAVDKDIKSADIPENILAALRVARQKSTLTHANFLEIEIDNTANAQGYSIYIHYNKDVFTGNLADREASIVYDGNYHLASEFVKQLIRIGQDPNLKPHVNYVNVCSEMDGYSSAAGMPAFEFLGCARYIPERGLVDPDFAKLAKK